MRIKIADFGSAKILNPSPTTTTTTTTTAPTATSTTGIGNGASGQSVNSFYCQKISSSLGFFFADCHLFSLSFREIIFLRGNG